jgi:DNA-binding MarR family transcriptional regulator
MTTASEETLDQYLADRGTSGLFTRLARVGLLLQAFQDRCLGPFGLRFIDFSVLRVLELAGPPHCMSPTRLSQIVLRPTGGMTQILDRLQRDGWVERSPDPSDRRKVIVALTDAGLDLSQRANQRYSEARAELLGDLSDAEVEAIDGALRRLLDVWGEPA